MFKRLYRSIYWFLLGILIVFAIAACNSNTSTKPNAFLTDNCRVMLHAMGETCVPLDPQRIVVLDSVMLEAAIALDKKPVGSPLSYVPSPISITDITDLGDIEAINLERVLSLKPDLILGIADSASPYSQLSQIAPTVLINFDHSGEWKKHFAFVGEVLGKSEQVKQIMADYYQRTEEFKQKINAGSNDLERNSNNEILVSVVRIYPTEITVYTKVGFPGTILEDAGLSRPPSQDLDLEQTEVLNFSAIQYPISKEVIDKADGDAVFVVVGNWDLEIKDVLASLTTDPLWSTLDAVQQGKVYEVGDYWVGNGPIAANAVLDDLFKYLIPLM